MIRVNLWLGHFDFEFGIADFGFEEVNAARSVRASRPRSQYKRGPYFH